MSNTHWDTDVVTSGPACAAPAISIVIPVYNEQDNVDLLAERVTGVMDSAALQYELIIVDDGSRDDTLYRLLQAQQLHPQIRVVRFRRNFGQTAAMKAGIRLSRGPVIVTMDGDLQNDPEDIPRLLEEVNKGYDIVVGWRKDRKDPLLSRTLPSRIANWLIGKITGVKVHDNGCSLKAYRSSVIKQVPLYSEMHRFIPAMSTTAGAGISEIPVRHHPRERGQSKYGLSRIGKVLLDVCAIKMLITCADRPLHWFFGMAMPFLAAMLTLTVMWAVMVVSHSTMRSSVVIPAAVLLLSYLSIHLIFTGLLAELSVRIRRRKYVGPTGTVDQFHR